MSSTDDLIRQIAEMRQRIASIEQERVREQAVTVTAVDTATSTFSGVLPDGQAVTPIATPLPFLPSPDDVVMVDLHGASPVYRPGRMTEQDTVALNDLSVTGDPLIMGATFSEHLAPKTQFDAGASRGSQTDPAATASGGGETGYIEATFVCHPGRLYEFKTSNIWVRPSQTTTTRISVNIKYSVSVVDGVDPPAVSLSSPLFTRGWTAVDGTVTNLGHTITIQRIFKTPVYSHLRLLLSLSTADGSGYIEMGSANYADPDMGITIEPETVQMWMTDLGEVEWTNRAQTNTGSGTPAAVGRQVRYYEPNWTRWFKGDGSVQANSSTAVQGVDPRNTSRGDQATQIGDFKRDGSGNSIATDLAGATIEKLELWLYARRWGNENGGTANLKYHTNTSAGSLNNSAGSIVVPNWKAAQGRWVDITSWASVFQAGTAKGIQVGPGGSSDRSLFGVFAGHTQTNAPQIRATFTR